MARDRVEIERTFSRGPDAVWSVLRDFTGHWHPVVAEIWSEKDEKGGAIRAFRAHGETGIYRERLTWFSDSERTLGYTHVDGIADALRYVASVAVSPLPDGGCRVTWTAEIEADEPRLSQIASGTASIFEMGLEALANIQPPAAGEQPTVLNLAPLRPVVIEDEPRLALTTTGDRPSDRLCLFIHGIGGGRANWDAQLTVTGHVLPAAALDLRGYGESALGFSPSTVEDYCADILRVMKHFGSRRLVLVGLSYGSWIATSFAMRHADLLDGLVLSGGCTGMSEASPEERERFRLSREVPLDEGRTPADFAPAVVEVLAGPRATPEVRTELLQSMAAIPAETYRDAVQCFTNPTERFDFSRLTMPVLMMTGEYDRLAPPAEIRSVAGRILAASPQPDVRFEVIPDAGHVCNLEQPAVYNRILLEFLGRLAP
jgi:pimeloyl-ACP methyl ester carboxylesterase